MCTLRSTGASRFHMTGQDVINECGPDSLKKPLYILVTGATSGIGIETARVLACAGAHVYAMGRDQTKLQEVVQNIDNQLKGQQDSGGSIEGFICDLNSLASVKQFSEKFIAENKRLNILMLNAGTSNYKFAQTTEGLEQVMGVNHIAQAYLTKLLIPKLIANAPSRIVVVSSSYHKGPPLDYQALDRMSTMSNNAKNDWGMLSSYQQSKLANLLFARALASQYNDKQVTAYSVHPEKKTLEEGVATTVYCTLKLGLENRSGQYFDDSAVTNIAEKWSENDINTFWKWTQKTIQERTANL
ncbi:unnamed protein product [Adineta steineri]|uniref:Uncharacterized protein n=1 Tax=Adineta steineri TaxID=433720 RepID=A0A815QNA7_9BILA|nr:unnamed protein product [Adineta steineri]CAF3855944.1 unnamed protein product [Adineta steineri]